MGLIRVINKADLNKILDFVHDRIFDLSDITFDKVEEVVTIPLTVILDKKVEQKKTFMVKRWKYPVVVANLIVKNVISIDVDDKDQIDQGCINYFTCTDSEIVINNSVPVIIRMSVSSFEMILEITNHVQEMKAGFSLGM